MGMNNKNIAFVNLPKDKQVEILTNSPGMKKLIKLAQENNTSVKEEFIKLLDRLIAEFENE